MTRCCMRPVPAIFATFVALPILGLAPSVRAADASAWDGDQHSAARLIAAASTAAHDARILRAGVEIRLAPGWKTYWRYPGDAGIPPTFDFSGSDNTKSVTVLWPAPQKIADSEGVTIGYKTNVVLPLHIVPLDAAKPVALRMKLDYAICERLCIPVQAKAALPLDGTSGANEAAVSAAEKRVPKLQAQHAAAPLSVGRAIVEASAGPPRLLVDIAAPAGNPVTLFAEGPTPDWALPLPAPLKGAAGPGVQRFSIALDGLPAGATHKGAALRLTAVSGEQAIETVIRLD